MKLQSHMSRVWLLAVLVWFSISMLSSTAAQVAVPAQFSATAIGQAGAAAGKSSGITIYLTGFTSDQDIQEYAATLKSKGQDGLVSALEKAQDLGRVAPTGSVGTGFRIARVQADKNGGVRIVLATNRPISFGELANGTRSRDYPIGIVILNLDKDGNGSGLLSAACKVKFNKKGELEVEHYGQKPLRLTNVRREK
jgi:hypothetical protein